MKRLDTITNCEQISDQSTLPLEIQRENRKRRRTRMDVTILDTTRFTFLLRQNVEREKKRKPLLLQRLHTFLVWDMLKGQQKTEYTVLCTTLNLSNFPFKLTPWICQIYALIPTIFPFSLSSYSSTKPTPQEKNTTPPRMLPPAMGPPWTAAEGCSSRKGSTAQ